MKLPKEIREAFAKQGAIGGKIGGAAKTEAKAAASRENGLQPVKKGSKPRGWPKGKKRK